MQHLKTRILMCLSLMALEASFIASVEVEIVWMVLRKRSRQRHLFPVTSNPRFILCGLSRQELYNVLPSTAQGYFGRSLSVVVAPIHIRIMVKQ